MLQTFYDHHSPITNNVILGDFNFPDSPLDQGKGKYIHEKKVSDLWSQFLSQTSLSDPFRIKNPKKRVYSYEQGKGRSRVDRAYVDDDNITKVCNFKYIRTPFNTAHKILTFDLKSDQDYGPGTWKLNSSVLKDQVFITRIEQAYEGIQGLQIDDPRRRFELFDIVRRGEAIRYTKEKAKTKGQSQIKT